MTSVPVQPRQEAGAPRGLPTSRAAATREAIVTAAEQLYAEHGLTSVSHRLISSTAGQGNVAAVNYHFGTSDALVRAIIERHSDAISTIRQRDLGGIEDSTDLMTWLRWLIQPTAEHLETLGDPTWWARFSAQVVTDPRYREQLSTEVIRQMMGVTSIQRVTDALDRCLRCDGVVLSPATLSVRVAMLRILTVHVLAERETVLAAGGTPDTTSWAECAESLVHATAGLLSAPI